MDRALTSNGPRLQMLVLDRTDPQQKMARFYVLSLEPTLFGDAALVREWGRWGRPGRRRLDLFADVEAAGEALEDWLRKKTRRGYRVADNGAGLQDRDELLGGN